jgi:hypothetical protein
MSFTENQVSALLELAMLDDISSKHDGSPNDQE